MKYAGLIKNDFVNGQDVCVSVWVQGCPHKCPGCHNPQTWDFDMGIDITEADLITEIIKAIPANGIKRNLSILGGEPLTEENEVFVFNLIIKVKKIFPDIKIFLWTGYTYDELQENLTIYRKNILNNIDMLIEGRFEMKQRDITLPLRGSANQKIMRKGIDF